MNKRPVSDLWNDAIDHVVEAFEKKHDALGKIERKSNAISYDVAAAIARSHRRDPSPPRQDDELDAIERDVDDVRRRAVLLDNRVHSLEAAALKVTPLEDLTERHRRLVEWVLARHAGSITEEAREQLRGKLHVQEVK